MFIRKSIFILLTAAIVLSLLFAACTKETEEPAPLPESTSAPTKAPPEATSMPTDVPVEEPEEKVVRMWAFPLTDDDDANIWKPLTEKFHSAHPNIKIEVEILPWADRRPAMLTAFAAGDNPDVAYFNVDMAPEFGSKGVLEPLQDLVPAEVLSDYSEGVLQSWSFNGNIVMLGILSAPWGSVYNKDVVEEVGWDPENPPYTWDDMREFCAAAKDKEIYCWGTSPNGLDLMILVWQAGGQTLNEDGTASTINSPEGLAALNFILEMYEKEWVPEEGAAFFDPNDPFGGPRDFFADGKQAIGYAQDMNAIVLWQDQVPGINLGTQPAMKSKRQAAYGGSGAYGIFSNSEVKDAALEWLLFLWEPENMVHICDQGGFPPIRKSALDIWSEGVDDASAGFAATMEHADGSLDSLLFFIEQYTIYKEEVQAAMLGQKTAEEALADMEARVNQAIAEATGG